MPFRAWKISINLSSTGGHQRSTNQVGEQWRVGWPITSNEPWKSPSGGAGSPVESTGKLESQILKQRTKKRQQGGGRQVNHVKIVRPLLGSSMQGRKILRKGANENSLLAHPARDLIVWGPGFGGAIKHQLTSEIEVNLGKE